MKEHGEDIDHLAIAVYCSHHAVMSVRSDEWAAIRRAPPSSDLPPVPPWVPPQGLPSDSVIASVLWLLVCIYCIHTSNVVSNTSRIFKIYQYQILILIVIYI